MKAGENGSAESNIGISQSIENKINGEKPGSAA